ncbi:MAG TPA: hypothetical protein VHM70_25545, partial [Polyangiaceae bacterium]|nr:hypothetical protein [Polyangiaceae bacterium]
EPKHDDPAWGWVKKLSFEHGALVADCQMTGPELENGLRFGSYVGPRHSFYPPSSKQNPVPGSWYLRHLVFSGPKPELQLNTFAYAEALAEAIVEFQEAETKAGRYVTTSQACERLTRRGFAPRRALRDKSVGLLSFQFVEAGTEALTLTTRFVGARTPGSGLGTIEDTAAFAEAVMAFQDAEAKAGRRWTTMEATSHLFRLWGGRKRDELR